MHTGSYNRVAAFARLWHEQRLVAQQTTGRGTFVPLAFQFDLSEDWTALAGVRTKLQMAHFKLSHSRAFYLRAYLLQTHEMLFDAHNHAFVVLGGVPKRGLYDNMRTAEDRVRRGKERDVNARFAAMVSHFLFEGEFCNPASGWEKGQVEKNVRDARHRLWQVVPPFPGLAQLNAWLQERCVALWHEIEHGKLPGTVADVWAEERAALMPAPRPFDGFVEHTKRISTTCLVHFERNRYSVPTSAQTSAPFHAAPPAVHRSRRQRRHPALGGHEGLQGDRGDQQGPPEPIVSVTDYRLEADLFSAVPELVTAL